jgi:hypothetical protein
MLTVLTQMRQTADCDLSLTQTSVKAELESRIIRIRAIQENTVSTVSDHGRRVTTTLSATSP